MLRFAPATKCARLLEGNPFADAPANRTVAIFLNSTPSSDALETVRGRIDEQVVAGKREIYVYYPRGLADTKLVIPAAAHGTARNMNTVAKLAHLCNESYGIGI